MFSWRQKVEETPEMATADLLSEKVSSRSTDKLELLIIGLEQIPEERMSRLTRFELKWENVDDMAVPNLTMEFDNPDEVLEFHGSSST